MFNFLKNLNIKYFKDIYKKGLALRFSPFFVKLAINFGLIAVICLGPKAIASGCLPYF